MRVPLLSIPMVVPETQEQKPNDHTGQTSKNKSQKTEITEKPFCASFPPTRSWRREGAGIGVTCTTAAHSETPLRMALAWPTDVRWRNISGSIHRRKREKLRRKRKRKRGRERERERERGDRKGSLYASLKEILSLSLLLFSNSISRGIVFRVGCGLE